MENKKRKRQIDSKLSKQVRIDMTLHKELRIEAAKQNKTIKRLIEEYIIDGLAKK